VLAAAWLTTRSEQKSAALRAGFSNVAIWALSSKLSLPAGSRSDPQANELGHEKSGTGGNGSPPCSSAEPSAASARPPTFVEGWVGEILAEVSAEFAADPSVRS
jgi:hypothetical protein